MQKGNLLWGVGFLVAAIFIILNQFYPALEVGIFGIVVTIFMICIIVNSLKPLSFGGILFPLAIIIIIFDDQLGLTAITPFIVLIAALLGTIGLNLLFGGFTRHSSKMNYHHLEHDNNASIENDDSSFVDCSANFGASIKYINSKDFKQANLKCSFGSLTTYYDNAVLSEEGATIYLDVSFGAAELYIPKEWNVLVKASSAFGGITEKNKRMNNSTDSKEVIIDGRVSFGGVDIYYV